MTDYLDGYGEGYFGEDYFEDYAHDEMEEFCPDEYADDGYRESTDPEPPVMDKRVQDDAWITPYEASVLGLGFGYEEGRAERRRKKQLKKEARSRRLRRYRNGW